MSHFISFFVFLLILSCNLLHSESKTSILEPDSKYDRKNKILSNEIYIRLKADVKDVQKLLKLIESFGGNIEKQILTPSNTFRFSAEMNKSSIYNSEQISEIIESEEPLLRTYRISFTSNNSPEIFCKELLKNFKGIEIAEPIVVDEILGSFIPNDNLVFQQALLSQCKIFDLWDDFKGDTNLIIGISDGGIYQEHEDLIDNIAPNWDEIPNDDIDNDGNGYIDDFIGCNLTYKLDGTKPGNTYHDDDHGTGVAGIAAASTDNSLGIAGVGFKCRFFPIKTAKKFSTSIIYGYESILYAAIRGVKVLNCSWGQAKQFSQIDQSIIDYAVARDVAIVAAGGNANGSLDPFYPASYFGVMSVGNVDVTDEVSGSSSLGTYIDIMAPGEGSYITTNNQAGYKVEPSGGTSFSAPVVSGALAMTRAYYPYLSPIQSIEFTRQCVDDISSKNQAIGTLLRGRLNGFKITNTEPMSIPGIMYQQHQFSIDDVPVSRIYENQTVDVKIQCTNVLGDASNLRFVLSPAYDFQQAISVVESEVDVPSFKNGEVITLDKFSIKSNKDYDGIVILRVDIYGDNNYHDFFMFQFVPTPEMTTFSNNITSFSVGDRGQIGFFGRGSDIQGVGVTYKNFGNMIYNAGLMVTAAKTADYYSSTGIFGFFYPYTDFLVVKPFTNPDETKGILNDQANYPHIGAEIEQIFHIPPDNFPIVQVELKVKNTSEVVYDDMAAGYFFDWDIMPSTDSNRVELFPEAIPQDMQGVSAAAEIAYFPRDIDVPYCGCASYSENTNYRAAATGMNYNTISDFTIQEQYSSLNTGTNIQFKQIDDINMVVGMQFPGSVGPNESRSFRFYFGCSDSREELAEAFRNALKGTGVSNSEDTSFNIRLNPMPAERLLTITIEGLEGTADVQFFDILGSEVLTPSSLTAYSGVTIIKKDVSSLPEGVYFVRIGKTIKQFIKL